MAPALALDGGDLGRAARGAISRHANVFRRDRGWRLQRYGAACLRVSVAGRSKEAKTGNRNPASARSRQLIDAVYRRITPRKNSSVQIEGPRCIQASRGPGFRL